MILILIFSHIYTVKIVDAYNEHCQRLDFSKTTLVKSSELEIPLQSISLSSVHLALGEK